tara:strand:+ start:2162 stop:2293 length:132 start_codon:yes stop_codon:yes gene_type:complete
MVVAANEPFAQLILVTYEQQIIAFITNYAALDFKFIEVTFVGL